MARGGNTYMKFVICKYCGKKGVYSYLEKSVGISMLGFRCKYCDMHFIKSEFSKAEQAILFN